MTLIVGVLCSDGVVLAADGAATYGAMGVMTMRQQMKKLTLIGESTVIGVSGTTGLAQRYEGEIRRAIEGGKFKNLQADQVMRVVQGAITPIMQGEFQMAAAASPVIGSGVASLSALSGMLVTMPVLKDPYLFRFDQQGSPEFATPDLPFLSIGSGYIQGDPFFAFIRRVLWSEGLPTVADGVLATVWTTRHAIICSPGGVADPIQVAVLQKGKAKLLEESELEEHKQFIETLEEQWAEHRRGFVTKGNTEALTDPPA